jgi:hypothetical protein
MYQNLGECLPLRSSLTSVSSAYFCFSSPPPLSLSLSSPLSLFVHLHCLCVLLAIACRTLMNSSHMNHVEKDGEKER